MLTPLEGCSPRSDATSLMGQSPTSVTSFQPMSREWSFQELARSVQSIRERMQLRASNRISGVESAGAPAGDSPSSSIPDGSLENQLESLSLQESVSSPDLLSVQRLQLKRALSQGDPDPAAKPKTPYDSVSISTPVVVTEEHRWVPTG